MIEFSETAHPIFRASSALERVELRSKGGSKAISANQLSIYGAVADMCREVSKGTMSSVNLKHMILKDQAELYIYAEIFRCVVTIRELEREAGFVRIRIGPVLNTHVCHHEDRYSIDMQVRSLFQDRFWGSTCEWS